MDLYDYNPEQARARAEKLREELDAATFEKNQVAAEKRARLLDEFAMAALTGILSRASLPDGYDSPVQIAQVCYGFAEAMLLERNRS